MFLLIFSNSLILIYLFYKFIYAKFCTKEEIDPFDDVYYQKLVPNEAEMNENVKKMIFP